ncbi:ribonuclease R family protein [Atopobium fossor]|uniref:ribonuclease R family protein n=1 Tax=Atopobium fossor TaxID=39487 RepID=UPI00042A91F9|nr:VacB/RNase II family 3'-5' exoribonuclease [Atopobium fossor]
MGRGKKKRYGRRQASYTKRKLRPTLQGTLRVLRPGVAHIVSDEGTFVVARRGLREAMDGDLVAFSLIHKGPSDVQAYVQSVIQRGTVTFLGSYADLAPLGVVVPMDERIQRDFLILPSDHSARKHKVSEGDIVSARIIRYPTRNEPGIVTIAKRLGSATELDLDMESVVASYGLAVAFPEAALKEARAIAVDVEQALATEKIRQDLRNLVCVTIDPADARDYDDAVSVRELDGGQIELGVHIADVSHYVPWNSSLDVEARQRTCSVYLADRVIPMLPHELSNDACSLMPQQDRLAMSVLIRLDKTAHVLSWKAFPSVIRSRARLTYEQVDSVLAGKLHCSQLPCEPKLASIIEKTLHTLNCLSHQRQQVRAKRGSIDFESVESRVVLDENNRPIGVSVRQKTDATSLVEEAMLLANECVAHTLNDAKLQCAYRVHEAPQADALLGAVALLRELDIAKGALGDRICAGDPYAIQQVLSSVAGTPEEYLVSSLLLRAQSKAVYAPYNQGHYALGATAYCHFTSPIRRYSDVLVHRALKALLKGKTFEAVELVCATQPQTTAALASDAKFARAARVSSAVHTSQKKTDLLPQLCRTCSEKERTADAAARASQRVKMAQYYDQRIGEKTMATVTGCERFGAFVTLDTTYADGLIPMKLLGDEWFVFDEAHMSLTGESTGVVLRPGSRVAVQVRSTNIPRGQIDLALISKDELG